MLGVDRYGGAIADRDKGNTANRANLLGSEGASRLIDLEPNAQQLTGTSVA